MLNSFLGRIHRKAGGGLLIGTALLAYLALRPVLGLGHELVVAGVAAVARLIVGTGIWEPVVHVFGLDPIYSGAAIRAAGGVEVAGFAVAGPLGGLLHGLLPNAFLAPDLVASGAAISMVAAPGAPTLGRALAAFGGDVIWLAIGLGLLWRGRARHWRLAIVGLLIQAQIATNHLLGARVSVGDLDASGLPYAVSLAIPDAGWFTTGFDTLSSGVRDAAIGLTLVVLGYVVAGGVLVVALGAARLVRIVRGRPARVLPAAAPPVATSRAVPALALAMALLTAWSPMGAFALGESNWQAASAALLPASRGLARAGGRVGARHTLRLSGATPVAIAQNPGGGWQYLVDGSPETIRGVGYNPQYAGRPLAERAALYDRDFAEMRRVGINTIEGWFEGQFDSVTLDYAQRNGIGVIMPFELNQDWPFDDPNVQQSILDHISDYIERYKNHPAVRMWSPGNENLHRILYARWVSQEQVPAARARADAFAGFLPRLVDRMHELDPTHPVIYRDAEDVYLGRVVAAFSQTHVARPWLVYGANVYSSDRLRQIIAQWPLQWPGRPLVISEFAPGGVGPADRPAGFQQQWSLIRSRTDVVLGGMAYTWATNGPEDLDRVFGLVDPNGIATDGALVALGNAYVADEAATMLAASTTDH